jgi:hypothetical protein
MIYTEFFSAYMHHNESTEKLEIECLLYDHDL